jgi:hypothetical protein
MPLSTCDEDSMTLKISRPLCILLVPALLGVLAVVVAKLAFDVRIATVTRDVSVLADIHPLAGCLSNLGVLLWCAASAVCFFARIALPQAKVSERRFLFWSGVLSAYFTLDDLFQIHEHFIPVVFGIWEKAAYLLIAGSVFAYLFIFREMLLRTNALPLLCALGLLAFSAGFDAALAPLFNLNSEWFVLVEDGAKWLGIVCWCAYFVGTAQAMVTEARESSE